MNSPISRPLRSSVRLNRRLSLVAITSLTLVFATPVVASAAPKTPAPAPPSRQNSAVVTPRHADGLGSSFDPSFKCEKPGHSHEVKVHANLADVHITHEREKAGQKLEISGSPQFTVSLDFKGHVECSGEILVKVPLGETGLELKVGPELDFSADGDIGADFTWQPTIDFGFTLKKHGFTDFIHSLKNGGGVDFTGKGTASLALGIHAIIETDGGVLGLGAFVGPKFTVKVSADSKAGSACWGGSLAAQFRLEAFVHVFDFLNKKAEFDREFDKRELPRKCSNIVFDGDPGTAAPPTRLGPYKMQRFAADPTAEGTEETQISGPTGRVKFDNSLKHDLVGSSWQTWSNHYTGDVYEDDTELPNGEFEVTVTLPAGTGAFYAYAEPNKFKNFDMSAQAQDGPSSGEIVVHGKSGAKYFGFYAHCGHTITSVTYTDAGGDSAMAIGEFGIARASSCTKAG
jgi:hypothetical protein